MLVLNTIPDNPDWALHNQNMRPPLAKVQRFTIGVGGVADGKWIDPFDDGSVADQQVYTANRWNSKK